MQSYKIKKVSQDDHVWTLKDEATIIATIDELIQDASHSILLSAWNTTLEHYRPLLEEKEREGISVEILTIGDLRTTLENTSTLHPMEHHEKLEPSQLVIVDEQSLLFAGIENETWKAIKTNSQPLVKVFTDFFIMMSLLHISQKNTKSSCWKMKRLCDFLLVFAISNLPSSHATFLLHIDVN